MADAFTMTRLLLLLDSFHQNRRGVLSPGQRILYQLLQLDGQQRAESVILTPARARANRQLLAAVI
jgi:hypothetical protein